jgi:hypoxanthine phosphoribosyltransferase
MMTTKLPPRPNGFSSLKPKKPSELRILLSKEQIAERVRQLGEQISERYPSGILDILCILKGSFIFAADLIRHLDAPVRVHFVQVSSYSSTESTGTVHFHFSSPSTLEDCDVLIIEDILDTGITLQFLKEHVSLQKPSSLKTCVLLDKPSKRKVEIQPDFRGFEIEDHFVVGYGLDLNELYRNLSYVAVLF